jgi:oligopeptide/dipeptide ABC transporter ATP-binding protein
MAYVPQDPASALNPVLRVGAQLAETLCAHQDIKARAARNRAVELLERVRMPRASEHAKAYPHELSGGMRQRAVIAMALANNPDLIIADEATTALDATVQAEILELLDVLCTEQGAALLFISHDLGVVAQLCNRALVMYAGRVVEEAPVETLLSRPAHPYTRALIACSPELGQPDKPLFPIAGQPPPMNQLPAGCHFAPRCGCARAECLKYRPELRPFRDGNQVRCIRAEELDPWNT